MEATGEYACGGLLGWARGDSQGNQLDCEDQIIVDSDILQEVANKYLAKIKEKKAASSELDHLSQYGLTEDTWGGIGRNIDDLINSHLIKYNEQPDWTCCPKSSGPPIINSCVLDQEVFDDVVECGIAGCNWIEASNIINDDEAYLLCKERTDNCNSNMWMS